ncbi:MAG: phosphate/phosphite/phosphonate ABC transporter substrate-binding protein [Chromatiaceae bacterium]|nr:phosphate/phosphite/phosphonate ABC transporter substrate-binding protein [Chromatiaceae bacterium]
MTSQRSVFQTKGAIWVSARLMWVWSLILLPCILLWPPDSGADGRLRLGVVSERPDRPSEALEQYGPLNAYLERRLGDAGVRVADLVVARDLAEMAQRIEAGEVDALIEGVIPTLKLERDTQRIRPSLLVWRKGQRQYHSLFFVRRDSPITGLQDLAGKTIAFESKRSTSAYFVPLFRLRDAGLEVVPAESEAPSPEALRYHFVGSELNQAYWVHDGRADAGAFNDGDWERTPAAIREELRVIARTPPLLRWLVSFSTDLAPEIEQAVSEVLLEMHLNPEGLATLAAAARIVKLEHLTDDDRANLAYWARVFEEFN